MHHTEFASRRTKLGLSQAQLARALRVHPNTVAQWERGDRPIARESGRLRFLLTQLQDDLIRLNPPRRQRSDMRVEGDLAAWLDAWLDGGEERPDV